LDSRTFGLTFKEVLERNGAYKVKSLQEYQADIKD